MKLGHAFLQKDKWILVKTISLEGIGTDLSFNIKKYTEFNNLLKKDKSLLYEIIGLKAQAEYLRDEASEKYQQLVPSKRYKRGILNPLGSLIKVITGNLDQDDAEHFDNLISNIHNREQATNQRITIVSEMLDHFMNTTKTLDDNTKVLDKRITQIENLIKNLTLRENNVTHSTLVLGLCNLFITNFRTIYVKLSEIETAMALSKVSVLHKSVIKPQELLKALLSISSHGHLMYPVNEANLMNLEETLSVKAYLKEDKLNFLIEIPLTDNITYNYFKMYSLPVLNSHNETKIIIPDYPFLMTHDAKYHSMTLPCKEVTAEEFLCTEKEIVTYTQQTCAELLMKYHPNLTGCVVRTIKPEELIIQQITPTSWILFIKHNLILAQTCDSDVTRFQLHGTYVITINPRCDVFINDIQIHERQFHSLEEDYKPIPVINLPSIQQYEASAIPEHMENIDLKGIKLDDIRHLNDILKNSIRSAPDVITVKSVSAATIVLYFIVLLIVMCTLLYKYRVALVQYFCKPKRDNVIEGEEIVIPPLLLAQ